MSFTAKLPHRAAIFGAVAILLCLLRSTSHVEAADPRMGFTPPGKADFSTETWTQSFEHAHGKLAAEYAFTEWKGVAWDDLYREFAPAVAAAEKSGDRAAFYLALHEYLFSIDDGHVSLPRVSSNEALIDALIVAQSGGSYGLGLAKLDDGRIIVAALRDGGSAERAGVERGAEVLSWDGKSIEDAAEGVMLGQLAASSRVATNVHRRLEQLRLLTRAPVGQAVTLSFRNPGQTAEKSAELRAEDDHLADMNFLNLAPNPSPHDEEQVLQARMLDGQIGYVRLVAEADLKDLSVYPDVIRERFMAEVRDLRAQGAKSLVLDLRGNHGGFDTLSADLCGVFAKTRSVFEKTAYFDQRTGQFLELTYDDRLDDVVDSIDVVPQPDGFQGSVAVLINPRTISSGEGLAKCISDLPDGLSVGFNGTNGSFGIANGEILMPAGLIIHFPNGRSLDASGTIQIDSRQGIGGVQPERRIPTSFDNILAYGRGEDVELREAVRTLKAMSN